MSLNKVNYIDNSTIITAKNLNDIQDNIIELQDNLENIKQTLPLSIEYGGTGATNARTARELLEITPENIGAISMELLWENASPTSGFGEQTLSIDCSKYNLFFIECNSLSVLATKGQKVNSVFVNALYVGGREIAVNGSSVTFNNCYLIRHSSGTASTMNEFCRPLKIYGIKGVS